MLFYFPEKMVKERLQAIRARIAAAAARVGRDPDGIALVCVTKEVGIEMIREAVAVGATDIGENRVQEALAKYRSMQAAAGIRWHMIGHLQTNKAKAAVGIFDLIHSVDNLRLAQEIQKQAQLAKKMQAILIEVNVSGEKAKYGVDASSLESLVSSISGMNNIMLLGLMAMAPFSDDPQRARPYFKMLKEMRDGLRRYNCGNIDMKHLSMGMSADFEVAIEEGADMVRIGSAIFK